jgi:hypothetical protein
MIIFRSSEIYPDPYLGWGDYVTGKIETLDIPGDHPDRRAIMNEPSVKLLAQELKKYLA